jgi:hypothetical protein
MYRPKIFVLALLLAFAGCTRQSNHSTEAAGRSHAQPLRISAESSDAAEPAVSSATDGSVYVAWVEHRPNREADVMLGRFDASGQSSAPPVRVNPVAGMATAWRGDPPTLAVSPQGTIYVGWTARVEPDSSHATDIYLSSSQDGGRTFAAAVKVNDDRAPAVHGMHSLAISSDGRIYVAWLDERNVAQPHPSEKAEGHHMESNREVFIATSEDNGRTFSANQKLAVDACPCCKTAIATASNHRVYVSWRQVLPGNFRHIAIATSTDDAKSFSKPAIVSNDQWVLAGCPVSGPALAANGDGFVRVTWYSEGTAGATGLYWTESSDGGKTFTSRNALQSGQVMGTPVLIRDKSDSYQIVWTSGNGGATRVTTAKLGEDGRVTKSAGDEDGELPAAALSGDTLFVAYVSKPQDKRSIWLIKK